MACLTVGLEFCQLPPIWINPPLSFPVASSCESPSILTSSPVIVMLPATLSAEVATIRLLMTSTVPSGASTKRLLSTVISIPSSKIFGVPVSPLAVRWSGSLIKPREPGKGSDETLGRCMDVFPKTSKTPPELKWREVAVLRVSWETLIKSAPGPVLIPPGEIQYKFPWEDKLIGLLIKVPVFAVTPTITLFWLPISKWTFWISPLVSKELKRWKRLIPLAVPPVIWQVPELQLPPTWPFILVPRLLDPEELISADTG